jgi:hypothetical protein
VQRSPLIRRRNGINPDGESWAVRLGTKRDSSLSFSALVASRRQLTCVAKFHAAWLGFLLQEAPHEGQSVRVMRIWPLGLALTFSAFACSPSLAGKSAEGDASAGNEHPPMGAAGFDFGASPNDVKQACQGGGKAWASVNSESGTCSGPVSNFGFDATVRIDFCNKRSCVITVEHRPKSHWLTAFNGVKEKLAKEYGTPAVMPTKPLPEKCRQEEQFAQCLEAGGLRLEFRWQWPTRQQVTFTSGKSEDGPGPAALRVQYVSPPTEGSSKSDAP